jgi:hypothetical protein
LVGTEVLLCSIFTGKDVKGLAVWLVETALSWAWL